MTYIDYRTAVRCLGVLTLGKACIFTKETNIELVHKGVDFGTDNLNINVASLLGQLWEC